MQSLVRALILVPLLLVSLTVLFFVLRPEAPSEGPRARALDVEIRDDHMRPGEITVDQGDRVTLRLATDRPVEFHLHGYDLERRVEPGKRAEVSFEATLTGRFEMEGHSARAGDHHARATDGGHSHGATGTLVVRPR